jgi:hypothetical protein
MRSSIRSQPHLLPSLDQQTQALQQLARIFDAAIDNSPPSNNIAPRQLPRVDISPLRVAAPRPTQAPLAPRPASRVNIRGYPTRSTERPHRYPARSTNPPPHQAYHVASVTQAVLPLTAPITNAEPPIPKHFAYSVIDPTSGIAQEYKQLSKDPATSKLLTRSVANELGRLAQGVGDQLKGTNTCFFIPKSAVPHGRTITYGRIVVSLRPQKAEVERTRLTVGGNLVDYPGDVSTKTANLTTAKILFKSVLSTPKEKFMGIDLKNFYLNTPLDRYEYMQLSIDIIPDEIIDEYNLRRLVSNGYVYIELRKEMYGLPQAGILANKLLTKRLSLNGYAPTAHTHGLWRYKTRPIAFTLVVDDFGVNMSEKNTPIISIASSPNTIILQSLHSGRMSNSGGLTSNTNSGRR